MHAFAFTCVLVCVTMVSLLVVTSCADINGHTRTHIKGPICYIPPHTQHPRTHTNMKGLAGLTVRCHLTSCCLLCGHIVIITCGVQCNTCVSQQLHSAVVGGGPDGGSGSEGEKEVGW